MSDIRETLYAGENDKVFVTVVSGERENPYKYDGIKNKNVDFCIVSVFPSDMQITKTTLEVELLVGETTHDIFSKKAHMKTRLWQTSGAKPFQGKLWF